MLGLESKVLVVARGFPAGRWLAVLTSVAVSGAMFYAQTTKHETSAPASAPTISVSAGPGAPSLAAMPASAPPIAHVPGSVPPPAGAPVVASAAEAQLMAANAPPEAAVDFDFELPVGKAPEQGLQTHTIWAARAISVMFLDIQTIGGFRQDALQWHPSGLAIDVMIPNYHTEEGIELGNQIAGYALANAKRWGVLHVIWRQGFYPGIGAPSWTADYGNETANHFDHVHIATNGGGYPTGAEKYFFGSIKTD
jgi:hypothetical protein